MADDEAEGRPRHFVHVSADGTHLECEGKPWWFAGANCYYLMTRAVDMTLRPELLQVLDAMQQAGLTVLRTWAFCDGPEHNSLQPSPGVFEERTFRALDWVIAAAGRRGIRVLLALTNYWPAYGGMAQYVRWSCERRGVPPTDQPEAFYEDRYCQDVFQNWLVVITSRVNTITGTAYREDPTILGWELINEARCTGDYSGSILEEWLARVGEFFKTLDPWHLLTLGSEGFLGSSTPGLLPDNPFDALGLGCDFARCHALPCIDVASIHLWPDTWLPGATEEAVLRFARRWLAAHVDLCRTTGLRKPLLLTEFGRKPAGIVRATFYEKVYELVLADCKAKRAVAGSCFWGIAALPYPDYDGFTVYMDRPARSTSEGGEAAPKPLPARPRLSWDGSQAPPDSSPPPAGRKRDKGRRDKGGRRTPLPQPSGEATKRGRDAAAAAPPPAAAAAGEKEEEQVPQRIGSSRGKERGASVPELMAKAREAGQAELQEELPNPSGANPSSADSRGMEEGGSSVPEMLAQVREAGHAELQADPAEEEAAGARPPRGSPTGSGPSQPETGHGAPSRDAMPAAGGGQPRPGEGSDPSGGSSFPAGGSGVSQPEGDGVSDSQASSRGHGAEGGDQEGGESTGDDASRQQVRRYQRLSSGIVYGAAAQMFEDAADPLKGLPRDDETLALIRRHAADIAKLNHPSSRACRVM